MSFEDSEVLIRTFTNLKISAAIFSFDGEQWGCSEGFNVTSEEAKVLAKILQSKGESKDSDVTIEGAKYPIINRDDVSISGQGDPGRFAVRKTQKAIVIGCWKDEPTLARGAEKVDNAADFMMNEGF